MNSLSNSIYNYTLSHFEELPLDKQFHFASRLATWSNDVACTQLVASMRDVFLPTSNPLQTLEALRNGKLIPLLPGNKDLLQLRGASNNKFPQLRSAARLLYWAALLDNMYKVDFRPAVTAIFSKHELVELYEALLTDHTAIGMLSTHAVNFLFLYKRYFEQTTSSDPALFMAIASENGIYDLTDPLQLQLCLYLLTHVIIADSQFYAVEPSATSRKSYHAILARLESLMTRRLQDINLDNKLEFLVCCKFTGFETTLEMAILQEAKQSVSTAGSYLVDSHNKNPSSYTTFDKSEHRSVLYVMATTARKA